MEEPDRTEQKIFPRNLTARAATQVCGNPANARPESGVDNSHPGLEFDPRNLDVAFFPGLRFGFQFLRGAKLVEVANGMTCGLLPEDADGSIDLWYIFGSFGAAPATPRLIDLRDQDGYETLRTVRALETGPVTVIIGRTPRFGDHAAENAAASQEQTVWMTHLNALAGAIRDGSQGNPPKPMVIRDGGAPGKLLAAIVQDVRSDYLDANGVIMESVVAVGDLTRSLCAPWQWDFADCGCHYWASNKPDLVMGPSGGEQILNFQRDRQAAKPATTYQAWTGSGENPAPVMSQPQMVTRWEELPIVIGERETSKATHPVPDKAEKYCTRDEIIKDLDYLAGVEHALCIEYLYAHYSLDAPEGSDTPVSQAAHEVFQIAIDEMRHLRWVNEALALLGQPPQFGRADEFGRHDRHMRGKFKLAPLTEECLQFFIDVEAPSRNAHQPNSLDGLYTHILASLQSPPDASAYKPGARVQIIEVIKLLIDEGHGHYERLLRVQALLGPCKNYLRVTDAPDNASEPEARRLQDLADSYYHILLNGLTLAFTMPEYTRSGLLRQARRSMHSLDAVGTLLAARNVGLRFTMPVATPDAAFLGAQADQVPLQTTATPGDGVDKATILRARIDRLRDNSGQILDELQGSSKDSATIRLVAHHRRILREMIAGTHESFGMD